MPPWAAALRIVASLDGSEPPPRRRLAGAPGATVCDRHGSSGHSMPGGRARATDRSIAPTATSEWLGRSRRVHQAPSPRRGLAVEVRTEPVREGILEAYAALSAAEYGADAPVADPAHLRWKFLENPQGEAIGIHLFEDGLL